MEFTDCQQETLIVDKNKTFAVEVMRTLIELKRKIPKFYKIDCN